MPKASDLKRGMVVDINHFMNMEDFSQYELNSADLDGQLGY